MQREIIVTKDGSSSIYVPELNENYHSIHGAKNEAIHVFLKMGLDLVKTKFNSVNILEIGLGTGLNAALTLQKCLTENLNVNYTGLEKYPLTTEELKALNYHDFIPQEYLDFIHHCEWESTHYFKDSNFNFTKTIQDVKKFEAKEHYQLIYFDAFAPNKQENMWSKDVFNIMYAAMQKGALLTTYCCRGIVKRTLQNLSFRVEKVAGPPGKREMINAWKP